VGRDTQIATPEQAGQPNVPGAEGIWSYFFQVTICVKCPEEVASPAPSPSSPSPASPASESSSECCPPGFSTRFNVIEVECVGGELTVTKERQCVKLCD